MEAVCLQYYIKCFLLHNLLLEGRLVSQLTGLESDCRITSSQTENRVGLSVHKSDHV